MIALGACVVSALSSYLLLRYGDGLELGPAGSFPEPIVAVGLAVSAGCFLRYPSLALFAVTAFVYLNLSQVLVRYHHLPSLLQILTFPVIVIVLNERSAPDGEKSRLGALGFWLLSYNFVLLLSTVGAREPELALARYLENTKALAIFFLIFGLACSVVRARIAVWSLLLSGASVSALGVFQSMTGNFDNQFGGLARIKNAHIYGSVFEPRIAGPLGDPNFFAQVLLLLVPLALYVARSESSRPRKLLAYTCGALTVSACVLTFSRGAALALAVMAVLILFDLKTSPRALALALAVTLAGLVVLPQDFTRRLETVKQLLPGAEERIHPDSSFEQRKLYTAVAWEMFLDHPMTGVGTGNYTAHYQEYADEIGFAANDYDDPSLPHYAHNLALEVAAETGLPGLAFFTAAIVTCFWYSRRAHAGFLRLGDKGAAGLAKSLEIGSVGYMVSTLFLHGYFQRHLYLVLGLVAALYFSSRVRSEIDRN
jgi:O-antigen ligase